MSTVTINLGDTENPVTDKQEIKPAKVSAVDLVAAQPWAILPNMLETIVSIARRDNEPVETLEARLGRPLQNTRSVSMRGSVAIVPVTGPVFRYANLFTEISGATSLEVLAKEFTAALDNPNVSAIVLNIDSPGGQATGISQFAQMVRTADKPVIAFVEGQAASAAYWIASAASEIVVSKTSEVGSIGAVVTIDQTKKTSGVLEIVSSQSPKKRPDLSTQEGVSQIQARIDKFAQVFIEDVALYRNVTTDKVLNDFGQGDMRMGAEAVAIGMADRVSTLEEVISSIASSSYNKGVSMTATSGAPAAEMPVITREFLAQNHPDLVSAIQQEGSTAERQRIQDVEAQSLAGHEALINSLKFDGKTSGAEAAIQVINAERDANANRAKQFDADAPSAVPHAESPLTENLGNDAELSDEDRAKAEWDKSADIRAEFGEFSTYLAFSQAHAKGLVKMAGKKD